MARIVLVISCGCGKHYRNSNVKSTKATIEEAQDHCLKSNHTLTIGGLIEKGGKNGK